MTFQIYFLIFVLCCWNADGEGDLSGSEVQVPVEGDNGLEEGTALIAAPLKALDGDGDLSGSEIQVHAEGDYRSEEETKLTTAPLKAFVLESKDKKRIGSHKKWQMGMVPYYIDGESYDPIITRQIRLSMKTIESASCVVFKHLSSIPTSNNYGTNWLHITNPRDERECVHSTRVGSYGETVMTLGFDCMLKKDITHALMHVLGFKDEVTHPQRDSFIRVLWENIQPKYHHLFAIQNELEPYQTLVEYDSMSIMHFHDRAFSSNGGATVTPLISGLLISPTHNLSQLDKMKLRLSFGHECNKRKVEHLLETCKNSLKDDEEVNSEEESDYSNDQDVSDDGQVKEVTNATDSKDISYSSNGSAQASVRENDRQPTTSDDSNVGIVALKGSGVDIFEPENKSTIKPAAKGSQFGNKHRFRPRG